MESLIRLPKDDTQANSWSRLRGRFRTGVAVLILGLVATADAVAQPSLVSTQPQNGAVDVPLNSSIVFVFDTPMEPDLAIHATDTTPFAAGSILWSGNVAPGNFQNSWNAEATVLTCTYVGGWPAGATVTWKINPANALIQLGAADDFFPASPASGSFTTVGLTCDSDGIPDDYGAISLVKTISYLQTSSSAPVIRSDLLPTFYASVSSPAVNAVTAVTLTGPGSVDIPLTEVFGFFLATDEFATQAELDAAHPAGGYTFSVSREVVGSAQVPMVMPAASSYPPIPQISNFTSAQSIDPTQEFQLQFNAFTGASVSDHISLQLADENGIAFLSAPDLCIPLVLPNTATYFTIPANTLEVGKTYKAELTFSKVFYGSTTTPPEFGSFGALQRVTSFSIATTGGVNPGQPAIVAIGFPSGFFSFEVSNLQPGTNYRVQHSATMQTGSWELLQVINTTTPMPLFDLTSGTTGRRFYRVITP